jgi:hypothetical protein
MHLRNRAYFPGSRPQVRKLYTVLVLRWYVPVGAVWPPASGLCSIPGLPCVLRQGSIEIFLRSKSNMKAEDME